MHKAVRLAIGTWEAMAEAAPRCTGLFKHFDEKREPELKEKEIEQK